MAPGRYRDSWTNRTGPGDARPTALQIVKDEGLVGKLGDKVVVITGVSSGIGIETARAIHATGAILFVTARNEAKAKPVIKEIMNSDRSNKSPINLIFMDNESLATVKTAGRQILEQSGGKVNIMINNAGVMATPEGKTKDGIETQFGVNHVAHFQLFEILKPALLASSTPEFNSRVVNVSSIGHRSGSVNLGDFNFEQKKYTPWSAYGQSKTANIWMANEIERRYGKNGIHGLSLHPGGIDTGLQVHINPTGASMSTNPHVARYMKNAEQGAATSVYAALSKEWEGKGGRYLSNCEDQESAGTTKDAVEAMGMMVGDDGYAPHAYDPEAEGRLWKETLDLLGLPEDDSRS
jgi:NAD(P)-dependent dehydrogenase (short-subunit alcohol dehydrogenase family)